MNAEPLSYNGFVIQPATEQLADGRWTTAVHIRNPRGEALLDIPANAANLWPDEDRAVQACYDLGRKIVDGEVTPRRAAE